MRKCFLMILCALVFIVSVCSAISEEKNNTWTKIASFRVGNGENEIPNQDEMGGGYISPRNFFCFEDNYYIFIGGSKMIKKISLDGKKISTINLDDYPYFGSIFIDKLSNNIFALARTEIYILDKNFQLLGTIDLHEMLRKENIRVNNIEVYNEHIYLYKDASSDLYILNYKSIINKPIKYFKDKYLTLDNTIIRKVNKNISIQKNEDKITMVTNENSRKEIKIPDDVGFLSFKSFAERNLYFLGLGLAEGVTTYYKLLIIDKDYKCSSLSIKNSNIVFGSSEPLIDIYKGHIFQLVLEDNEFFIYKMAFR